MSDMYQTRGGKLVLKGEVKRKARKRKKAPVVDTEKDKLDDDALRHGGWRKVLDPMKIKGPVALQLPNGRYLLSIDDGALTTGDQHDIGEGPSPQEIVTAIQLDSKHNCNDRVPVTVDRLMFAFKTGFNRYVTASCQDGQVTARAEAIGPREQWTVSVVNDGMHTFENTDGSVLGGERLIARIYESSDGNVDGEEKLDASGNLRQFEENQARLYQKFQDKRLKLHPGTSDDLRTAQKQGELYGTLLDRRERMKSDRYCK